MKYIEGIKYQLKSDELVRTKIIPDEDLTTDYIYLSTDGALLVLKGYCWDGPSGPTIDTKNAMLGSLYHDALYELMRKELLDLKWRLAADDLLVEICQEEGMSWLRAEIWERGVKWFARSAALPRNRRELIEV